jgi:HD-GYP domain-containing protein (c-di-GMP phosphodiesterase class II)
MKLVRINDNLVGQTLANNIYTENGVMFLNKGSKISENMISRLKKMNIYSVYIEDGNDEISLQEVIPTTVKLQAIKHLKEIFDEIIKKEHINENSVFNIIKDIMNNVNLSENAVMLSNLAPNDEVSKLAVHSLDVTILTIIVGVRKRYDENKLIKLGTAALLHDIGRLFSKDKYHVKKAQEILKKNPAFTSTTYMAIYYMYEREDGSGVFGIMGEKIHEFAKLLGICDEYITDISSENPMLPHVAVEKITAEAINKFDKDIYKDFIQSIYCYPNGLQVKLNNGQSGVVVMQNVGVTTRPVLAINNGDGYKFCNLIEAENLTLFIKEVIM